MSDGETVTRILRNSARCGRCGDEVESKHRHDFVSCSCLALAVDGGKDYLRRGYDSSVTFEDTSITEQVPA